MTILQYVEAHPWWTLVYLTVISSIFNGMFRIVIKKGKD